jgi:nitrate reductase gamma subunit
MLDILLFGALPYVAITLFLLVSIQRYRRDPFTFSSLSSQFLESRKLFWGSVPFHVGILTLFFGHLVGFLFPRQLTLWTLMPVRLFIIETAAFVAAILSLVGLVGLMARRFSSSRLRVTTSTADIIVYALLLFQIVTGMWIALYMRWGTAWYAQTAVPYLWSVIRFQPDIQRVAELDLMARLHIIGAFVVFAVFGFTRLVHALVAPVPYLWRPLQLVIWNRGRTG